MSLNGPPCYILQTAPWVGPNVCFQHALSRSTPPKRTFRVLTTAPGRVTPYGCGSSSEHRSRRAFLRRTLAAVTAVAFNAHIPLQTRAVCGEPDPFFAHYLDWEEGMARGRDGRGVHYRLVGNYKKEVKAGKFPVLYLGDAGIALASGETLELLGGTDRRVLFVDLLGVGESQALGKGEFDLSRGDAVALAREEAVAVLGTVGISKEDRKGPQSIHIIASGFGLEVADALLEKLRDEQDGTKLNVVVASVAAEGWTPIETGKNKDISFDALQGSRICAVEGGHGGNISIVRKLYEPANGSTVSPIVSAIGRIAKVVPTIALRTFGVRPLDEKLIDSPLFVDKEFSQAGRIAHLASADDVLSALDQFYEKLEGSGASKDVKRV